MRERSIGIGALGFHALLQRKNIPWESSLASSINKQMFKHIRGKLDAANKELGKERGEAGRENRESRTHHYSGRSS